MLVSPLLNFASPYLYGAAVGTATCLGLVMALNTRNPDTSHVAIRLAKCIGKVAIPILLGCYLGGYPGIVGAAALCYWYWRPRTQADIPTGTTANRTPITSVDPLANPLVNPWTQTPTEEVLSNPAFENILRNLSDLPQKSSKKDLLATAFQVLYIPNSESIFKSSNIEEFRESIRNTLKSKENLIDKDLLSSLKLAVRFASFDVTCCCIMLDYINQQLTKQRPTMPTAVAMSDLISALQGYEQSTPGKPLNKPLQILERRVQSLLSQPKPKPKS